MLSSRQSLYMMEKLHFFIKSIKKDVVQKWGQIIYCSKCFLYYNAFEQLAVVRNCAHDLAPNCHQIKAKKHQIFFSYFVENCIEISFLFFLKELFLVEIENLLRLSKENREKATTEIKYKATL